MEKKTLVILDDEEDLQLWAKLAVNDKLFKVVCPDCTPIVCKNADVGGFISMLIENECPSVILTDIKYGSFAYGFDIAEFVSHHYPQIPVIGMSNGSYTDDKIKQCGMYRMLDKSHLKDTLNSTIQECLHSKEE